MFTIKFWTVLLSAVVLMSACAPAASLPAAAAPAIQPPAATVASQASSGKFDGLSSGLDNATQARIRTVSEVMGAPNTSVYVNGAPAFNGGIEQKNIPDGKFSGFLYVQPGVYTITLVPEGGTPDQALFKPVEVKAEAGHRYTVAAMGQIVDKDIHGLVVDETALEASLGAGKNVNLAIDINNLKGPDSITEQAYGKTTAENIKYGEVRAWFCPVGSPVFVTLANMGTKSQKIFESDPSNGWADPASFVLPWYGPDPSGNYGPSGNASQGTSEKNVVDFLAGFEAGNVNVKGHIVSFSTLLNLIDKAGLRDQLANSGPYFLLAPTDAAFETMPKAEMDALLNDPQALMNLFKAHMVDGYFPYGSLSGVVYDQSSRTLTGQLGNKLSFEADNLNGRPIGPNYTVGNGNRVIIIFDVLPYK